MNRRLLFTAAALVTVALAGLAVALDEDSLELRNLGIAQLENEQPAEAEATFRRLVQAEPKEPLGHANLAVALLRQQKSEEALGAIDRARNLAPRRGDLEAIRGEILKWAGRPDEALVAFEAAADRAGDDLEVLYALYRHASTLRSEAAEASAAKTLDRLAALRPDNLLLMLQAGNRAIAADDRAAASQAFLRVRELLWQAPEVAGATLDKVLAALEAGDLKAARVPGLRLENVLKISPMYQQGQRELTTGILGVPVLRFADEPPPSRFGNPVAVRFNRQKLSGAPTAGAALVSGDFDGDQKPDLARILGGFSGKLELRLSGANLEAQTLELVAPSGTARLLAADLDNDGHLDLLPHGRSLAFWRGDGQGGFTDASADLGLAGAAAAHAVALDYDIEGDLDLATAGGRGEGDAGGLELWRNSLDGPLSPVGDPALPRPAPQRSTDLLASDLDRDGDLDLVVAHAKGVSWIDNLRQGHFRQRTAEAGLDRAPAARAAASADLDGDGWPELLLAGDGLQVWQNREGRFEARRRGPLADRPALTAVASLDADNDGRLDLALAGDAGVQVLRQVDGDRFEPLPLDEPVPRAQGLTTADLDRDGDLDLLVATGDGLFLLTNEGGNANGWLEVRLRGLDKGNSKNNLLGLGATLEVRAGDAYQFREATGDLTHFGLGAVGRADLLRVVWTNGVPQNRIQPKGKERIVEEQVLKGSCPFLYVWDGSRMAFVTDLLWGAPIGLPAGPPGVYVGADPAELVKVVGAVPADGAYRMRLTEELWEAAFFDRVSLWVVDHPEEVEVASSLRIQPGQVVPEAVLGAREVRPVHAAWNGRGEEVTRRVQQRDEVYAAGYEKSPYQGVARPWEFVFDLGSAPGAPIRLLLDGWIFPADASLNLAVAQRGDYPYLAPRLEVETGTGWQVLLESMGHPAGKTKTMVVDTPPLPDDARRLRIVTSLWLHWDRIAWTPRPDDEAPQVVARLDPTTADLRYRGFSAPVRQGPNAPHAFDYARMRPDSPWLPFAGRYTRYGDVRELLREADDRSVILAPGDEVDLIFDVSSLPAPRAGWQRTVFLESHGWDKDADRNTYRAETLEPLPFRAMSGYPYGPDEAFPDTPLHRAYREEWLTREIAPKAGLGPSRPR